MERGAAQPGREGRGAGRMAWLAVAAGAECVFRARTLWNGVRLSRAGRVGGRAGWRGWRLRRTRNAFFAQGPYGTGRGSAGPGGSGGGPDGVAGGCGGRGMRFSRKDPMERGAGQQGRDGRGPDRTARLAASAGAECDFRARTLWNGVRLSRAGRVGGRAGGRGWRLRRVRNAIFAQGPYGTGRGSAGPGGSGGRAGWRGWRLRRGAEYDFRARTLCRGWHWDTARW
jgi:hypothetical protein